MSRYSHRFSEAVGASGLAMDRHSRTMGFARTAKADLQAMRDSNDPMIQEELQWLECFLAGLNARIILAQEQPPVEFTILQMVPEEFNLVEVLTVARFINSALTNGVFLSDQFITGIGVEPVNSLLLDMLGEKKLHEFAHGYDFNQWPSMLDTGGLAGLVEKPDGSNAWAVKGKHTKSGKAMLAGDPHLPITAPSMFMEAHIATKEVGSDNRPLLNAAGVFIPGLPGIFIGHTDFAAWSVTVSSHDGEDFFVEKIEPCAANDGSLCYLYKGELLPVTVHDEVVRVKGSDDVLVQVMETHHGPVFTKAIFPALQKPMAYSSVAMQSPMRALSFLRGNLARDWQSFRSALQRMESAQINIVYADVYDNIAYQLVGSVPLRGQGYGILPSPGWTGEYEWESRIPLDEMPTNLNPEKGFIASANNCPVNPLKYKYFLGATFMSAYRAARIEHVLAEAIADKRPIDAAFNFALQEDALSIPAKEFAALIASMDKTADAWQAPDVQLALGLLADWLPFSGSQDASSVGAAMYHVAARQLSIVLLSADPILAGDEDTIKLVLGAPINPLKPSTELLKHDIKNMLRMLREPENSYWMQAAGGIDVAVPTALSRAVSWLRNELGSKPSTWTWGRLHTLDVKHTFDGVPGLGAALSRRGYGISGDSNTPMQTCSTVKELHNYSNDAFSPSYRLLVDMADITHAEHQKLPGNSGSVGSPFYDDAIVEFFAGKTRPMLFTEEDVAAGEASRQVFITA